jgi:glycosylphosphatidylinositol transamidase (GPIT) subunit GPI8/ABC-type branched-subunit amino acid transport system substrate-binding protein
MKRSIKWGMFLLSASLLWAACDDDTDSTASSQGTTARICVVMPGSQHSIWQRDVDWAVQNFKEAQVGLSSPIQLEVEWLDEEADDIDGQLSRVAADTNIVAIVGPYSSSVAYSAVVACNSSVKPLILPIATSAEFQRMFADKAYVWNLAQSDITQCELLLTQAVLSECTRVSLLTSNDQYGQSFKDWFAYQARELGIETEAQDIYNSDEDIRVAVERHAQHNSLSEMLLFAPSTRHAAEVFDEAYGRLKEQNDHLQFPMVLCSDVVNASELRTKLTHDIYEGVAPCASPMSGFDSAYRVRYGENPTAGEAHLYDAISLVAYALTAREGREDLNTTIRRVVDGRETWNCGWLPADMRRSLVALRAGDQPDLAGVSGDWTFDVHTHSAVLNTTYAHWVLRDSTYTTLEYLSTDGSGRTTSTLQAWEAQTTKYQAFNANQADLTYSELADRYAVVVGTSVSWANYRHQADALAMYQLLKRHGYPDDHIILIIADNLAYNTRNLYPGVVRVRPDGENVYEGAHVDYRIEDITFADLDSIMMGHASARLPKVLPSGSQDNVIVFWCGHGSLADSNAKDGLLAWGEGNHVFVSGKEVADVLRRMQEQGRFRKLLLSMDACYSGMVGLACEGIPGVLVMTAARENESSKADVKDDTMGIWLSNAFTRVFQETIDENPDISIRDLYYYLARATKGSHVTIYNDAQYGNLFHSSMEEYLGN